MKNSVHLDVHKNILFITYVHQIYLDVIPFGNQLYQNEHE